MDIRRKNSRKRTAVLGALAATKEHPSVDELYRQLKPDYPELSLGTVYRNLSVLQEEGLAQCVAHVAGQDRFDGRTDPHAHFICRRCGRVMDMELPESVNALAGELAGDIDCAAERVALNISGLCRECSN